MVNVHVVCGGSYEKKTLPNTATTDAKEISYTGLISHIEKGEIKSVQIQGKAVTGELKDGKKFTTFTPEDSGIVPLLQKNGVEIKPIIIGMFIASENVPRRFGSPKMYLV